MKVDSLHWTTTPNASVRKRIHDRAPDGPEVAAA